MPLTHTNEARHLIPILQHHKLNMFQLLTTSQEDLVQDNSQFPQQAGTSAIPHKQSIVTFPDLHRKGQLEEGSFFKCHGQFCMDLHSRSVKKS